MKNFKLIAIGISLISTSIFAQDETDFRSKLTMGLKAGANYSNVYDSQGEDFEAEAKLGFAGGVFFSIPLGESIGVQPEILISQKGFKATGVLLGSDYKFTRTTTFLDVPLLFALKPIGVLTILAGPQFSYLLKQKDVFVNGSTSVEQEQEFENDEVRKNMLCFLVGLDFNFEHIVVGTRAGWDFTKNNGDGTSTTPRYKNVWFQGTIGYRF